MLTQLSIIFLVNVLFVPVPVKSECIFKAIEVILPQTNNLVPVNLDNVIFLCMDSHILNASRDLQDMNIAVSHTCDLNSMAINENSLIATTGDINSSLILEASEMRLYEQATWLFKYDILKHKLSQLSLRLDTLLFSYECNSNEVIFREHYSIQDEHNFNNIVTIWNTHDKQFNDVGFYWWRRSNLSGVTIRNTVIQWDNFIKRTNSNTIAYEGMYIDLVLALQNIMNFTIDWMETPDGNWGNLMKTGYFNGLVGQLERGEADISATGLTITHERSQACDFTRPVDTFLNTLVGREWVLSNFNRLIDRQTSNRKLID